MNTYPVPAIAKDGHLIDSVETWLQFAPPKGGNEQWVDGRSAKELAKAWFPTPGMARVPLQLESLLSSHADIAGAEIKGGSPEVSIKLDDLPGGTRNADLVLSADRNGQTILLTVEAKADEPFDTTIGVKLDSAPEHSNIPKRVDHLCRSILGATPEEKPSIKNLRYQLLHATAATLIAARERQAGRALFVIHELITDKTDPEKLHANHIDLIEFIKELSGGTIRSLDTGTIIGPLNVPGGPHVPSHIPLYVGKIRSG